jgi:plasmid stability protein
MFVEKTTVYLPDDLKQALRRSAARRGMSEAELIRQSIRETVGDAERRPNGGLFRSGQPIARCSEELLDGFGQR